MSEHVPFSPIEVELRDRRRVRLREIRPDDRDGIDLVAGARYYVHADNRRCEFAITVTDGWQGVGLASRLLRELIQAARVRGLKQMEGFVLAGNSRMLDLARRLGFTVVTDPNDMMVKIVRLDLTDAGN